MATDETKDLLLRLYEIVRKQQQSFYELTVACSATNHALAASRLEFALQYGLQYEGLKQGVPHQANVAVLQLIDDAIRRLKQ